MHYIVLRQMLIGIPHQHKTHEEKDSAVSVAACASVSHHIRSVRALFLTWVTFGTCLG